MSPSDGDDAIRVAVRVPATSANLGPGFDALGVALNRYLVVGVVARHAHRVTTEGEGAAEVPTDDTNLVWRSLLAFCRAYEQDVPEVSLAADNALPLERGLGSSSAAIVAGLMLAQALTGHEVGDLEVADLATRIEGHPDNVAPAVMGGFVAATTASDGALVMRRAQPDPRTSVVLAVPSARQGTDASRAVLPESLAHVDAALQASRAVHVAGVMIGAWTARPGATGDLLHEPGRLAALPASGQLVAAWRDAGLHAWLSGAGPAVATAVPTEDDAAQAHARQLASDAGFEVSTLAWDLSGAVVCSIGRCAVAGLQPCADCPRGRLA